MKIYLMDGSSIERIPKSFEFRANTVSNWIKVVNHDGSVEKFRDVGAISYTEPSEEEG